MSKQKATEKAELKETLESSVQEYVRIGEIWLASETLRADTLARLALSILKDPDVKAYLRIYEIKKVNGSASYAE